MIFRRYMLPVALGIALVAAACDSGGDETVKLDNKMDQVSYSIGYQIGLQIDQNMQSQNIELNPDVLSRAIKDAISGTVPALSDSQMNEVMMSYQAEQEAAYMADMATNLTAASVFLVENAKKDGVISLADSLQYSVIVEGSGATPSADDMVRVHYKGELLDGTVFDSSIDRGEPTEFMVGQVIPGWSRILLEMQVGDKWKVWIPPALAYGEQGAGSVIPPNSLLIFEVELLGIVDQDDSAQ